MNFTLDPEESLALLLRPLLDITQATFFIFNMPRFRLSIQP